MLYTSFYICYVIAERRNTLENNKTKDNIVVKEKKEKKEKKLAKKNKW